MPGGIPGCCGAPDCGRPDCGGPACGGVGENAPRGSIGPCPGGGCGIIDTSPIGWQESYSKCDVKPTHPPVPLPASRKKMQPPRPRERRGKRREEEWVNAKAPRAPRKNNAREELMADFCVSFFELLA